MGATAARSDLLWETVAGYDSLDFQSITDPITCECARVINPLQQLDLASSGPRPYGY